MSVRIVRWVSAGFLAAVPIASQELGPPTVAKTEQRILPDGRSVAFEGFVYTPDGAPAEGAVVVTSAGGQSVVDAAGHYLIEARLPPGAESVQVTAVGRGGANLAGSVQVAVSSSGWVPVSPLSLTLGSSCTPSWLPTFGAQPGHSGTTLALAVYDDGGGPALYVGGAFSIVGSIWANRIVRWDGTSWSALGSGIDGFVHALTVYDDGGGPALYAGGEFTTAGGVSASRIARWDGTSWSALGSGIDGFVHAQRVVRALAVYDDGSGPALYAGGKFTTAGGVSADSIARWDGTSWSALGSGLNSDVRALAVHDDGSGPALYAGGSFTSAGGVSASRIARWNGTSWSALGSGMSGYVSALSVYDDGGGPVLFAGGGFSTAGGVSANRIARWDGSGWSALGSGVGLSGVAALVVYDDGSGPALYAAGDFTTAGGVSVNRIARWDGTSWSALGGGLDIGQDTHVAALTVYDDGGGAALYPGGYFTTAGGAAANSIARWDGTGWSALGSGMSAYVWALSVYDDGGGAALYAGGYFTGAAGGVSANRIARWDGTSWSPLGSGMNGMNNYVRALVVHDDGSGAALYAGGSFLAAGGVSASRIARWDGTSWSALGGGVTFGAFSTEVLALTVHDDGGGQALYAGGDFTTAGGVSASRIARWDGTSWSPLGSGLDNVVRALTVYDDGSGPALYAGGSFTTAGGVSANRIARWDGSGWSALGSGMGQIFVDALVVYDDGSGPALYAGGIFTTAGGVSANGIARWDGTSWSALGSGMSAVYALSVHDDGSGPALYAGGGFTTAGGVMAAGIARWDGTSWSALGSGMSVSVDALAGYDDGGGPALYVAGAFSIDSGDSYLAKWGGCPDTLPPVLDCPSSLQVTDRFPNGDGEVVLFFVPATDNLDPSPAVSCSPPSGSFFPQGTTLVTCTATDVTGNESQCQFPVVVQRKTRPR